MTITVVCFLAGSASFAACCVAPSNASLRSRVAGEPVALSASEVPLPVDETTESSQAAALPQLGPSGDGVFPRRVLFRDRSLALNGTALCEWGFFAIDLYTAALYTERRVDTAEAALAGDQSMAIHLEFARSLTGEQLRQAYEASVRANTGESFERYEVPLNALLATMRDVDEGDTFTFTAEPGSGLWVQGNGDYLASIEDPEFASLFVRLYLGDKPPTEAVREGLLGRDR